MNTTTIIGIIVFFIESVALVIIFRTYMKIVSKMCLFVFYVTLYVMLSGVTAVALDALTLGYPADGSHFVIWLVPLFISGMKSGFPIGVVSGLFGMQSRTRVP